MGVIEGGRRECGGAGGVREGSWTSWSGEGWVRNGCQDAGWIKEGNSTFVGMKSEDKDYEMW
ncbi:hypothetical protein E2C01_100645 [Portunus trituberculatus]|uniref:Uncharacterized protein n=1 Tax=Portunus trituberculatus TaxID=210409 RepID=A0A5B7K7G0_PORTR|nr:hypothetical protein [Portunus trituberculatus]